MARTLGEKALVEVIKLLPLKRFPKTRVGDYFSALQDFVSCHDRLPSDDMLFNDCFFKLTTSSECLHPLRAFVTDKEYLKWFVKAQLGDEFNIPPLAILRSKTDVKNFDYPRRCVIKPTHLSGSVILRRNGEPIDLDRIVDWLNTNWYFRKGGWEINYRNLVPKVIVEPFVFFGEDTPNDYRIFCVNGLPKMIQVNLGRFSQDHSMAIYTPAWDRLPFSYTHPPAEQEVPRPGNLDRMLDAARKISRHFSIIRVDLYSDGEAVYVGELTNCPEGALAIFEPRDAEKLAGRIIFEDA